jgi:phosphoglycolate phosphatase
LDFKNKQILFWDLDGTITDPKRGIIGSYQKLLEELCVPVPSEDQLLWVIGPPLRECIKQLVPEIKSQADLESAVTRYRHWYVHEKLMYLDTPYDGILELLRRLKENNRRMFVATAKAHSYARQILDHWNLTRYFEDVCGSELDGTRSVKGDLLEWMITKFNLEASKPQIVMIGDRKHDITAATANQISSIGVSYGYGSFEELAQAAPNYIARSIPDLHNSLIS